MRILMREVQFKHKNANHTLHLKGKKIVFKNGRAQVDDEIADAIIDLEDNDYMVKPERKVRPKKQPSKKKG